MKTTHKRIWLLAIVVIIYYVLTVGILFFQHFVLMEYAVAVRAVLAIVVKWLMLVLPIALMIKHREKATDIGFSREKIPVQLLTGVYIAIILTGILAGIPALLGYKEILGSTVYSEPWQFVYQLIYMTLGVALVEEVFFRGYVFKKLLDIKDSRWFAIIISSVLFGLAHMFNNHILAVIPTAIIGVILCLFREKIRHCTTLSLIIAHGFYNTLISLIAAFF